MALENACLFSRTQAHPGMEHETIVRADDSGAGSSGIAGESLLAHQAFYVDHLDSMLKPAEALVLRAERLCWPLGSNRGKSFSEDLVRRELRKDGFRQWRSAGQFRLGRVSRPLPHGWSSLVANHERNVPRWSQSKLPYCARVAGARARSLFAAGSIACAS